MLGVPIEVGGPGSFNIALGDSAGSNLESGSHNMLHWQSGRFCRVERYSNRRCTDSRVHCRRSRANNENANAIPVVIDSAGQLGTVSSSRRFKNEIKPMDKASEAIPALKPVTFHYKSDNTGTPQFGLIAEEVANMNPDLVVRDENGEIYTVRYDAVNAMLLNEFLKEHRKVEQQEATIVGLKSMVAQQQRDFQTTIAQQQKQIEALTAGLQKVSAELELNKPVPEAVANNQ